MSRIVRSKPNPFKKTPRTMSRKNVSLVRRSLKPTLTRGDRIYEDFMQVGVMTDMMVKKNYCLYVSNNKYLPDFLAVRRHNGRKLPVYITFDKPLGHDQVTRFWRPTIKFTNRALINRQNPEYILRYGEASRDIGVVPTGSYLTYPHSPYFICENPCGLLYTRPKELFHLTQTCNRDFTRNYPKSDVETTLLKIVFCSAGLPLEVVDFIFSGLHICKTCNRLMPCDMVFILYKVSNVEIDEFIPVLTDISNDEVVVLKMT